jgi:AcrR family transcriptional regulator
MPSHDSQNGNSEVRRQPGTERSRIVAAFGRAAAESGYRGLTIEGVERYAGLPRERIEAHFESLEAGVLATQQAFLERLRLDAIEACAGIEDWSRRVRSALTSLLHTLTESSELARVLSVEVAGTSLGAAEHRFEVLDGFAGVLAEGRTHCPPAVDLPPLMEQAIVGGLASIVSRHLLAEEAEELLALGPELVELVLIPYVGIADARRVAREEG